MPGKSKDPEERARKLLAARGPVESRGAGNGSPPAERFAEGNDVALQHGARSGRVLGALAARIEAEARAGADWPPHLDSERYAAEVQSWAWSEAVVERLRLFLAESDPLAWLTETDTTEEDVRVREGGSRRRSRTTREQSALEQLRRWEDTAARRRQALGLNPVSAARLCRDMASARISERGVDLAKLIQQATAEDRLADEGEIGGGRAPE